MTNILPFSRVSVLFAFVTYDLASERNYRQDVSS